MEKKYTHVLFLLNMILLLSYSNCIAQDVVYANQEIKDGSFLVSKGGMFESGFFSPGKSKNRYLGIWYKKISNHTVVWVANKDTPITDGSGVLKLSRDGNLMILNGENYVVWSSNSTLSVGSTNMVVVMELLDNGNLVVWNKSESSTDRRLIWQSFDYPGDTLLPGMKFGRDLERGLHRMLTSWKSPDDPSTGEYNDRLDTNGYPQTLRWRGEVLLARLGPWNGLGFSGFPIEGANGIYSAGIVINDKEIYQLYESKRSVVQRIVLTWEGKTQFFVWIERIQDWIVYSNVPMDICDSFSLCGPYGICSINNHPPCTCMQGFEPKNQEEWDASDWVSGCIRIKPLNCESGNVIEDGFRKLKGVKVPDTRRAWHNVSMTLEECKTTCQSKCSCTAYASVDIRNGGSGCLLWFDELIDTREYDANQDIYIRTNAPELEGLPGSWFKFTKRKITIIVLVLTSSALTLAYATACVCRNIIKRRHMKRRGNRYMPDEQKTNLQMEVLGDLQCFSLFEVAKATCNFNTSNKIGEGGFGLVYKGVLENGREIAVKRLSETSQQGLDEFMNEVICIAKLQHRNLVKLIGYCIHKSELILIYEYLPNKSLDFYLFDGTTSVMLDWPQRFNIIHGMARGILYLHQDSRLQIIHRDLKASNILLDNDMNPKISDFGLARNFVGHDTTTKTKKVVGTYGYISPEYAVHGRFSIKSDVFSFGVLVLEIISGKRNREFVHGDQKDNLLGHAWRLYKEGRSIELVNGTLQASCVASEVLRSIHVALLCVQHHAEDRPTMLSVVLMLVSEGVLPQPKQPAFFTGETHSEVQSLSSINDYTITHMVAR
ncbi:hypothetical protein QVD17_28845 [Tagetes erecta]|uniref:Receptor-like serine/threonine-protein kinase n=1 Tax=Tagetes erecta TaxID=13708 RepID=A0AAD8KB97_TARER|nr:hypothetical protein QVD17_28845 [Tagetes erecta]